jgi:hypothetical protein
MFSNVAVLIPTPLARLAGGCCRRGRYVHVGFTVLCFQAHLYYQALLQLGKLGFIEISLCLIDVALLIPTTLAGSYTALPVVVTILLLLFFPNLHADRAYPFS